MWRTGYRRLKTRCRKETRITVFGSPYFGKRPGGNPKSGLSFTNKQNPYYYGKLLSTRTGERFSVTNTAPSKEEKCGLYFYKYYSAEYMKKKAIGFVVNIKSRTIKQLSVRKNKKYLFLVDASDHSCTIEWVLLYLLRYIIDHF
jgi:hypothetical protein